MTKFIFIILLIPSILYAQSYQEGLQTYAKSKKVSKKKKSKPKKSEPETNNLIGFQGLKFGNFVMRVGLRGNAIVEKYTTYGYGGLQISFLMNF